MVWVQIRNEEAVDAVCTVVFWSDANRLIGVGTAIETLSPYETRVVPITLHDARLQGRGIQKTVLVWNCIIESNGSVGDTVKGSNALYTTLNPPQEPWSMSAQRPNDLPRPELLHFVCEWANGAKTPDRVADLIVEAVFALGRTRYPLDMTTTYFQHCSGRKYTTLGSENEATDGTFIYDRFMRRLKATAKVDQGHTNCVDCATIVSVCANLLGCALYQIQIMDQEFDTCPIVRLGSPPMSWECENWISHHVAWEGPLDADGRIWDACLVVDGEGEPLTLPHTETFMIGNRLGRFIRGGDRESYRYRFIREDSTRLFCYPTDMRVRRPLHKLKTIDEKAQLSKKAAFYLEWFARILPEGAEPCGIELLPEIDWALAFEASWVVPESPHGRVYLQMFLCPSDDEAEDKFQEMVKDLTRVADQEELTASMGDESRGDPDNLILFRRKSVIASLERSSYEPVTLTEPAVKLDLLIVAFLALLARPDSG